MQLTVCDFLSKCYKICEKHHLNEDIFLGFKNVKSEYKSIIQLKFN